MRLADRLNKKLGANKEHGMQLSSSRADSLLFDRSNVATPVSPDRFTRALTLKRGDFSSPKRN